MENQLKLGTATTFVTFIFGSTPTVVSAIEHTEQGLNVLHEVAKNELIFYFQIIALGTSILVGLITFIYYCIKVSQKLKYGREHDAEKE